MRRRTRYDFRQFKVRDANVACQQPCARTGCVAPGAYRAPRENLAGYYWFCHTHVQEYNRRWDYLRGRTPREIEDELRMDTCWRRPTWPLGQKWIPPKVHIRDPYLGTDADTAPPKHTPPDLPEHIQEALGILDLAWPVDMTKLKARYKAYAKAHHPDRHDGDVDQERQLKQINVAYRDLCDYLNTDTPGMERNG